MKKLMMVMALLPLMASADVQFDYEENGDGTITLTDVSGEIPENLVIPSTYDGKKVTVIAAHFLDGEDRQISLKSLVVSEGVLEIGCEAFADCPWLATVQLPASLQRVDEEAFSGGPDELLGESSFRWSSFARYGLRQISVASGNKSLVVKDGVLIDVNQGLAIVCCVNAKSVSLPEGVTMIGEDCFDYCLDLETVEFPTTLHEVGEDAFLYCRSLKRLDFSNTGLRHVNRNCFCGCDSLQEVKFPVSLRQLGALSFCWCRSLVAVTFLGDAPEISDVDYDDDPGWKSVQANIYVTSNDDLSKPAFVSPAKFKASIMTGVTTYVSPESKGWGVIPGTWQGCPVRYIGEAPPPQAQELSVSCPGLVSASFTVGVAGSTAGIPIEIETQSGVKSVKVSKLPPGMKYDKKSGCIVGAPTKAGTFNVTIKVTAKSGAVETLVVPVTVAALPDWVVGTFGGMVGRFIGPKDDDEFRPYGMITMKITTAGKISAKIAAGGKTYSFSAKGFDSVDEDGDYHFRMTTKKGEVYEGEISAVYHNVAKLVQVEESDGPEGSFTISGRESYFAAVWRNEHGKDGRLSVDPTSRAQKVMDAIKAFKTVELAQFDPAYGSVVLKIDARGTTKLSGKTADGMKISGTSFLMLDDDGYHVIADMVVYDKKSGNVYDITPCWQPIFDGGGNVVDWDWECCEHDLRIYPFE